MECAQKITQIDRHYEYFYRKSHQLATINAVWEAKLYYIYFVSFMFSNENCKQFFFYSNACGGR